MRGTIRISNSFLAYLCYLGDIQYQWIVMQRIIPLEIWLIHLCLAYHRLCMHGLLRVSFSNMLLHNGQ